MKVICSWLPQEKATWFWGNAGDSWRSAGTERQMWLGHSKSSGYGAAA